MDKVTTIKVWTETRRLAKILAANCGETLLQLFHRLVTEEIARRNNG